MLMHAFISSVAEVYRIPGRWPITADGDNSLTVRSPEAFSIERKGDRHIFRHRAVGPHRAFAAEK
jgi:hypothetical protein